MAHDAAQSELSPAAIDRGWPHQVALAADKVTGSNYKVVHDFCNVRADTTCAMTMSASLIRPRIWVSAGVPQQCRALLREGPCLLGIFPPWLAGRESFGAAQLTEGEEPASNILLQKRAGFRSAARGLGCPTREATHFIRMALRRAARL